MSNCSVHIPGLQLASNFSNGVYLVLVCIVHLASSVILITQNLDWKKGGTKVATHINVSLQLPDGKKIFTGNLEINKQQSFSLLSLSS
jgi:hypothetical protein